MSSDNRSFTIVRSDVGIDGGRYTGKAPYNVAAKVARSLFSAIKGHKNQPHEIRFTIRETTEGSTKKEFTYIGMKKRLHKAIVVKRGDVEITIHHKYHVKSCHA